MGRDKCDCPIFLDSISVDIEADEMIINIEPQQVYKNYKEYVLCLGAIPAHTGIEPVAIDDGVGSFPIIDNNGQPVVSGQFRPHKRYYICYGAGGELTSGTMPEHFTCPFDELYCMEYSSQAAIQTP